MNHTLKFISKKGILLSVLILMISGQEMPAFAQSGEEELRWLNFDRAMELAEQNQKKVLVFTEAEWCTYCKKMRKEVFPREEVQKAIQKDFYLVSLDIESEKVMHFRGREMTEMEFSKKMNLYATPTFIFMNHQGEIIGSKPGYTSTEALLPLLKYISTGAFETMEYESFLKENSF